MHIRVSHGRSSSVRRDPAAKQRTTGLGLGGCVVSVSRRVLKRDDRTSVFGTLKTEFAAIGVHFNLKTAVYCPAATAVAAASASGSSAAGGALPIKCGIRQAVDGTKVLGAPVGTTQYQVDIARKRLSTSMVQISLLPQLDFGDAMLILRKSIVPRARFLASVMPPDALAVVATEWDAAIVDCLTSMFRSTLHPRCFPSGPGCLGISKMVAELALDRVNGWARSKEVVENEAPSASRPPHGQPHGRPHHTPRPRGGHGRVVLATRECQDCRRRPFSACFSPLTQHGPAALHQCQGSRRGPETHADEGVRPTPT
jgi:hypothetical protein